MVIPQRKKPNLLLKFNQRSSLQARVCSYLVQVAGHITLLLGVMTFVSNDWAFAVGRDINFPIVSASVSNSGSATAAEAYVKISFVNISPVTQTVTAYFDNNQMNMNIYCSTPAPGVSPTPPRQAADCRGMTSANIAAAKMNSACLTTSSNSCDLSSSNTTPGAKDTGGITATLASHLVTDSSDAKTINYFVEGVYDYPGSTVVTWYNYYTIASHADLDTTHLCAYVAPIPQGLVPTIDQMSMGYSGSVRIHVNEDQGAVLANLTVTAHIHCGGAGTDTQYNFPLNGGRPF